MPDFFLYILEGAEVRVLGHNDAPVCCGVIPQSMIVGAAQTDVPHVNAAEKVTGQDGRQR